ncbi:MCE family protein, partial [Actinomadura adrarensis]
MALKSFRDRNPLIVGTASIVALSVAVTVSFLTGTLGLLEDRYTMSGVFAGTGGLRSGNDVQVAGV